MSALSTEPVRSPDLDALRGNDEAAARDAFDRLWPALRPVVLRHLARRGFLGTEAEDAAQEAGVRVWQRRRELRAGTRGGVASLACRTALWTALSRASRSGSGEPPLDERAPPRERALLDAIFVDEERRAVGAAADRIWLGVPVSVVPQDVEVAAAVLRLVLAHGFDPGRAAAMFGRSAEEAESWKDDPAIVARAAFGALCWPGPDLAAHVLRPPNPLRERELGEAIAGRAELDGWSPAEARAVCLREIHGMDAPALARLVPELEGGVESTIARAVGAYPFRDRARALREGLGGRRPPGAGLWKRVVLEYAAQGLGRDHALQRSAAPASELGVALSATTLDNWLGRGRLFERLRQEFI